MEEGGIVEDITTKQSGGRTKPVPISREARKQQLIDEILTLQNK